MTLCAWRRKRPAVLRVSTNELASHRRSASGGRVLLRVAGVAVHCQRKADSAKLAHVCWSGSSDGHHPYLGTAQPAAPNDGPSHSAAFATGANFIVVLRFAVPASPCRV